MSAVDVLADLTAAINGTEGPVRERRGHRENLIHVREAVAELIEADDALDVAQTAFNEAYPYATHTSMGIRPKHSDPIVITLRDAKSRRAKALARCKGEAK